MARLALPAYAAVPFDSVSRQSPRIRFGRSPVSLHRSDTVRGARDIDEARRLLAAARAELGPRFPGLLHDLLSSRGNPRFDDDLDERAAMRALAQQLLDGALVLVTHEPTPRLLDAPHSIPISDLLDDDPGAEHPLQPRPAPAPLPPPSLPPSVDPPPTPAPRDPISDRAPRCVRLVGMLFAPNRSFLLPEAMEGIRLLAHMYAEHPEAELLVVGHTDTTGTASRNRSLSLARARSILQFVTDDVDGWCANYDEDADYSRRWGAQEDLSMLATLPSPEAAYYGEHHAEHTFEAAVRRFQAAKELVEDGDPGPITRRALITDYMAIDGTTLPSA